MIVVAGAALIDRIESHDGRVVEIPGGGPYNVARTIGRLGICETCAPDTCQQIEQPFWIRACPYQSSGRTPNSYQLFERCAAV